MTSKVTTDTLVLASAIGEPAAHTPISESSATIASAASKSDTDHSITVSPSAGLQPKTLSGFPPLFAWLASYTGFMAIILASLGYTMAIAVENEFGISRDSLLTDWSHLVSLGVPVLLKFINVLVEALASPRFFRGVLSTYAWQFVLLSTVVLLVLRSRKRLETAIRKRKARLSADAKAGWLGLGLVALSTLGVAPIVFMLVMLVAFPAVLVAAFGVSSARAYLYETVIEPAHCLPLYNLAERRLARSASLREMGTAAFCVAITRDRKHTDIGRVVLSGVDYVLLFDPNTGVTRKVPTDGAVIEVIASVD